MKKKERKKIIIHFLLIVVTCLGLFPILDWNYVKAAGTTTILNSGIHNNYMYYDIQQNEETGKIEVIITGVYKDDELGKDYIISVTIPDSIDGYPVTTIGAGAFSSCTKLSSVSFGTNIQKLYNNAFNSCTTLERIIIPANIEVVDFHGGNPAYRGPFYNCVNLNSVTFVEGTTEISQGLLNGCVGLESINIPNTVRSIGDYAFAGCSKLNGVVLPTDLKEIGAQAFGSCVSLDKIELPADLETLGCGAFYGCTSLEEVNIPAKVKMGTYAGENYMYPGPFYQCSNLNNVTFADDATEIQGGLFYGCTGLIDITIPENITFINGNSFKNCSNLQSVNFSDNLKKIENSAFLNCTSLEKVLLPENLEFLACNAFANCTALKSVKLPLNAGTSNYAGANYMYPGPFGGSNNLTDVEFPKDISKIMDALLYQCNGVESVRIPSSVNTIGYRAFKTSSIQTIYFEGKAPSFNDSIVNSSDLTAYVLSEYWDSFESARKSYDKVNWVDWDGSSSKYSLKSVKLYYNSITYNLLETHQVLNTKYKDTKFDLEVVVEENRQKPFKYEIYQGKELIASSKDGKFEDLLIGDFIVNKDIYIFIYSQESKVATKDKLNFRVTEQNKNFPSTMSLGKGITFKVGKDVPLFGGMKFSLDDFPLLPFTYETSGDKVKVTVNTRPIVSISTEKGWEWFKALVDNSIDKSVGDTTQSFRDLKKWIDDGRGHLKMGAGWKLDLIVTGYLEGSSANNELSGKIVMKLTLKGDKEFAVPIAGIPIVIGLDVKGSVAADGNIEIIESDVIFNSTLELSGELGLYVGVGFANLVSAGVFGNGSTSAKFLLGASNTDTGLYEWSVSGKAGLKAKVLGKTIASVTLFDWSKNPLYLYKRDIGSLKSAQSELNMDTIFNEEYYVSEPRTYLESTSEWLGETQIRSRSLESSLQEIKYLQNNTYTQTEPQIISCGDTYLMVYIQDAGGGRTDNNRTQLVYSLYNQETSTWADPIPVHDGDTADFGPYLYSDGSDIYLVWQNAKELFPEGEMEFSEILEALNVAYAKFDLRQGKFSKKEIITRNEKYGHQPRVAVSDDKVYVSWYENSDDDIFGISGSNVVYIAKKVGNAWESRKVYETDNAIITYAMDSLEDQSMIAMTYDVDKDIVTADDQSVEIIDVDGNILYQSDTNFRNAQFAKFNGRTMISWQRDNSICYIDSTTDLTVKQLGIEIQQGIGYQIIGSDEGECAVLYTMTNEDRANIYLQKYDKDSEEWGNAVQITEQDAYIQDVSALFYGTKIMMVFNQKEVDIDSEDYDEINHLCWTSVNNVSKVEISDIYYNDSILEANSDVNLSVTLKNEGIKKVKALQIVIKDETNQAVNQQDITVEILPGEEVDITTTFRLPDIRECESYKYIVVDKDNGNIFSEADFTVGYPEFYVQTETVIQDGENVLKVSITNNGIEASAGIIKVYDNENEDNIFYQEDFEEIRGGDTLELTFNFDNSPFDGNEFLALGIQVESEKEQLLARVKSTISTIYNLEGTYPCIVSFDYQASEFEIQNTVVEYNTTVTEPKTPVREGYIFVGWYLGDVKYDFTSRIVEDIILSAKWKVGYTVTFNPNGGTGLSKNSIVVTADVAIGTLPTVSRIGYIFLGWYTERIGGSKVTSSTKITKNQTVYARWEIKTYTVKFNQNGGSKLSRASVIVKYNNKIGALSTVQRKGYSFQGWYTAIAGGNKVTAETKITKDLTLYARWNKVVKPDKVKAPTLKNSKSKQMVVNLKNVKGAKGYEIKYSANKKFTKKTTKTTTTFGVKKTIKKLKKNKTYYVKLRAYKLDSAGKKVYGKYSSVRSIAIKK